MLIYLNKQPPKRRKAPKGPHAIRAVNPTKKAHKFSSLPAPRIKPNSHGKLPSKRILEDIMNEMFCFQCQQTAHNTGCTGKAGVCGKKADTANNQDDLIGALIALACTDRRSERTDELI